MEPPHVVREHSSADKDVEYRTLNVDGVYLHGEVNLEDSKLVISWNTSRDAADVVDSHRPDVVTTDIDPPFRPIRVIDSDANLVSTDHHAWKTVERILQTRLGDLNHGSTRRLPILGLDLVNNPQTVQASWGARPDPELIDDLSPGAADLHEVAGPPDIQRTPELHSIQVEFDATIDVEQALDWYLEQIKPVSGSSFSGLQSGALISALPPLP